MLLTDSNIAYLHTLLWVDLCVLEAVDDSNRAADVKTLARDKGELLINVHEIKYQLTSAQRGTIDTPGAIFCNLRSNV